MWLWEWLNSVYVVCVWFWAWCWQRQQVEWEDMKRESKDKLLCKKINFSFSPEPVLVCHCLSSSFDDAADLSKSWCTSPCCCMCCGRGVIGTEGGEPTGSGEAVDPTISKMLSSSSWIQGPFCYSRSMKSAALIAHWLQIWKIELLYHLSSPHL